MATTFSRNTALIPPSGTTSDFGALTNVTFGDLDGDGDQDAVVGNINSSTPLRYFLNSGSAASPSFTEQTGTSNPFNTINTGTSLDETITGVTGTLTSAFATLVDIDGDNDLDLFTGSIAGNIRYYENTDSSTGKTTPTFAATTTNDTIGANNVFGIDITEATSTADLSRAYSTITFVDIDGDGDLDAFLSYYDTIDYYQNTGSSTSPAFTLNAGANPLSGFTFTVASDAPSNGNRVSLDFVQLEGRTTYDAVVVSDDGSIRFFENTGSTTSPTLTERTGTDNPFNSVSSNTGTGRSAPSFVDIDNDGDNEAFFGAESTNQDIQFFENGGETLTHTSGGVFSFGNTSNGSNLSITVSNTNAAQITNVNLTFSGSSTTNALFSVLPDSFLPNSFSQDSQTYILQDTTFSQGQSFTISFEQFSGGGTTTINSSQVTATETSSGSGVWTLSVDTNGDGSSDLQFTIQQTTTTNLAGTNNGTANTQFNGGAEIIELTAAATGSFTIYREAEFNNVAGLYKIDDATGAVGGIAPGASGYAQAAIQNRVTGADLQVGNQQTSSVSGVSFDAGLYAPFIVVDTSVDSFLSNGGTAYFAYSAANADGQDHLILLGNNLFGFEDLSGGGDFDYNDLVIQANFA